MRTVLTAAAATLAGAASVSPALAEPVTVTVLHILTREPLPHASVVFNAEGREPRIELADDAGQVTVDLAFGSWTATAFYDDRMAERPFVLLPDEGTRFEILVPLAETCVLFDWPPESYLPGPWPAHRARLDATTPAWWLTRERDVVAVASNRWAGASPAAVPVIYLGGARRLPGAPAPSLALLDEAELHLGDAPVERASGAGGTLVAEPRAGHDHLSGAARLALARDAGFELAGGGAIVRDAAWWSAGTALARAADGSLTGQVLASVNGAWDSDTQLRVLALHAGGPEATDSVADLSFLKRTDDATLSIEPGVSVERLVVAAGDAAARAAAPGDGGPAPAAPTHVDRLAGRMVVRLRPELRGWHRIVLGGEVGGGRADGETHADTSGFVSDQWEVTPHWTVRAGLRWDHRRVGGATAELWAPRLALAYAWGESNRRTAYATAERVSHLDQGVLGAWRSGEPWHDEASAGAAAVVGTWWLVGAGVRARWAGPVGAGERGAPTGAPSSGGLAERGAAGGEAFASFAGDRTRATASLSTLDEAVAVTASRELGSKRRARVEGVVRATVDRIAWGTALRLRRDALTLAAELFDLDRQADRTARLVISATW